MENNSNTLEKQFFFSSYTKVWVQTESENKRIEQIFYKPRQIVCILKIYYNRDLSLIYKKLKTIRHENLATVYDVIYCDGNTYVIEEAIDGETLAERLRVKGPFSEKEVLRIMERVCDALEQLHTQNPSLIHRDIKPSNVMIREDGSIKLIDFDTVRYPKEEAEQDTALLGTKEYASPEHYGYGQTGIASDIYSAGAMMNELLTGDILIQHKVTYKGRLRPVIMKCIRIDAEKRFSSAKELKKRLLTYEKPWGIIERNKRRILIGSIAACVCIASSVYWREGGETWPDLGKAYEEERSPFLLLENEKVDRGLKELLGTKYSYVKECLQVIDTEVEYWEGIYFMKGAVPGLYNFMEAAITLSDDRQIECGFLEGEVCYYYASDEKYYETPSENMLEWLLSYEDKTIQFHQDSRETGAADITGTYVCTSPSASMVITEAADGGYEIEGHTENGFYTGDIAGELEEINSQQFSYTEWNGDNILGKMKILVNGNSLYVQTVEGHFGGLNAYFDGTYKKQGVF